MDGGRTPKEWCAHIHRNLLAFLLLSNIHRNLNRGTFKTEFLAQATFDVSAVTMLKEAGSENHEARWTRRSLRREQDTRLLASTQWMRMGGLDLPKNALSLPVGIRLSHDSSAPRMALARRFVCHPVLADRFTR